MAGNVPARRLRSSTVHRHANGAKTAVLLAAMTGLILLAGAWIGGSSGLTIAFLIALAYQPNGWIVFIGLTTFQMLITVTLFGGLARQVRRA